ncbi:hypothetical protein N2152v2_008340 [Parachlorella kessleri]
MSKKNNKHTRQRHLEAAKEREKEALLKRQDKLQKRKADDSKKDTSLGVKATATKKTKKKAIRIKKNVVIRGIKVRDAESKKKVKEVLAAEEAMREMMVDEAPAAKKEKKAKKAKPACKADGMVLG